MSNKKGGYKECTACKGFGLVKKEYIPCAICTKYKLTSCVQCENKKLLGPGPGRTKFSPNENMGRVEFSPFW